MTKVCSKCGEEKPATSEYYAKAKANKDGFKGKCKECDKQYRKENKDKINAYNEQWRKENKEYHQEYNKQYYQENVKHIQRYRKENAIRRNEYGKQWRKENKNKIKQYYQENAERYKQYYQENQEYIKQYSEQYRKENADRYRQYSQRRRALKESVSYTLTLEQWKKIKDDFNNECAYCGMTEEKHLQESGQQLHQEHFVPLSKGGKYSHSNIIPACRSCNCSKYDTDFFEWYPTYEYYNEEREQFILEYLGYTEGTQQLILEIEAI